MTLKRTLAVCALLVSAVVPAADGAAQPIRSGPSSCKAVALTFDMCPVREGAGYDAPLIDMLMERRVPATFFLSGRWITKHEAEVKALLTVPFFEVGTHGQVHAHLPTLDADHQRAEISRPVLTLQKRYGYRGLLFRPPYGEFDDTTVEIAQTLGLQFILWSAVSGTPIRACPRSGCSGTCEQRYAAAASSSFMPTAKACTPAPSWRTCRKSC